MEIKGIGEVYKSTLSSSSRNKIDKYDRIAATDAGRDVVKISSGASFFSKVEGAGKIFAADLDKGISSEKLGELKAKYKGDSTPVSGMDVANAMFGRIFG